MKSKEKVFKTVVENKMPHLGTMLKTYIKLHNIMMTHLAKSINRNITNISNFNKQPSFQTAILWELSHALNYNFFMDLAWELPPEFAAKPNQQTILIESLQKEIEALNRDKELLQKIIIAKG